MQFVPLVLLFPEMHEMYVSPMKTTAWIPRAFEATLRDFARWEYGRNAEAWLLSQAAQVRPRKRRRSGWLRRAVRAWRDARRRVPAVSGPSEALRLGR